MGFQKHNRSLDITTQLAFAVGFEPQRCGSHLFPNIKYQEVDAPPLPMETARMSAEDTGIIVSVSQVTHNLQKTDSKIQYRRQRANLIDDFISSALYGAFSIRTGNRRPGPNTQVNAACASTHKQSQQHKTGSRQDGCKSRGYRCG